MNKYIIEMIISEQIENENFDAIILKKTYELCEDKDDLLETTNRHHKKINRFINKKMK